MVFGLCKESTPQEGLHSNYIVQTKLDLGPKHRPSLAIDSEDSGKLQYEFTKNALQSLGKVKIRDLLIQMLRREDELRLSVPCQNEMGKIGEEGEKTEIFLTHLQSQVCIEFGVDPLVGVDLIRSAMRLFPGDMEIMTSSHYIRYNRMVPGKLSRGDIIQPATVVDSHDLTSMELVDIVSSTQPVVLIAGSHS